MAWILLDTKFTNLELEIEHVYNTLLTAVLSVVGVKQLRHYQPTAVPAVRPLPWMHRDSGLMWVPQNGVSGH